MNGGTNYLVPLLFFEIYQKDSILVLNKLINKI